ncbi:nucleotidyltransferase domain-containing protein [Halocella sp. SP3-1]|uniref:type VII toxin-antitoxin system MntA family adenylyltransferase antitoxin n=1 Tax=Halocella sp. SP3-1 TaxID=2382161 RepID=UPI000F7606ED|nr:nucleotidyltransferase domain-containing protein [Halocella sp. SP3-1]AZO93469.1 nucleotidyltransferase domain-containing protein [Halocella sp. SP3-1]
MERIKDFLYQREEIIFAYLYGSLARGTENKLSDIDLAVYINEKKKPESGTFGYRSGVITELQTLVERDIDLIILNDTPLLLAYNVLKDGKLLFEKSTKMRVNFHESIMSRYLDFLPLFKVQENYLKKRLAKGYFGR